MYHAIKSTLGLLIPIEVDFTVDFFRRLDGHLGPRLTNMSADLLDVFGRLSGTSSSGMSTEASILSPTACVSPSVIEGSINEDAVNIVYFNEANKAMKNTTPNPNTKLSVQDIEIQHGVTDLNEDIHDILEVKDLENSRFRSLLCKN